jgi:hypothetical protein
MRRALSACLLLLLSSGCDDLAEFEGEFEGTIVGGNFVRSCFAAETEATLVFDPDQVASGKSSGTANRLTTSDGVFDDTPLKMLAAVPHDQISRYDFPGPARLRNYVLMARPTSGPLAARDVVVFVSLLKSGRVEVRVMGRSIRTSDSCPSETAVEGGTADPEVHEYFGVFLLDG